ncbi:Beta-glucosidase BoGH3B [Thalassocella blandensis]|nr:Beta-glucosidase BoGH3B [Thalassocella blandensis]
MIKRIQQAHHFILAAFCTIAVFSANTQAEPSTKVNGVDIEQLLNSMSLKEKIGQLHLLDTGGATSAETIDGEIKEAIRQGAMGSFINVNSTEVANALQRIAVEEGPHKIPLIMARDVIHGYKTIFPIPLGQAATWNPSLIEKGSRISAIEASADGIRWTFAPMIDVSRDPRWGRIAESYGEDAYLNGIFAQAAVNGFQGKTLDDPTSLAACAKHFVGYSAVEGGRDYNTTYIPEPLMHNYYLPPFKDAIDSKVATVMAAFTDVNGIPATANHYLMQDVLRKELQFDGVLVSDWGAVDELVMHGYAKDSEHAAQLAMKAGIDIEMVSEDYVSFAEGLLYEGRISMQDIDTKVRRVLTLKAKLGLFKRPYADAAGKQDFVNAEYRQAAKLTAMESLVLLKNHDAILPLKTSQKIALIGPMADAAFDQMGTWALDGEKKYSVTVLDAFNDAFQDNPKALRYASAIPYSRSYEEEGFKAAIKAAKKSDVIVMIAGEEASLSGEAHSRADITLPGAQEKLIKALKGTGKPLVVVLMAGRQIALKNVIADIDSLIMAWHPGTMAGPAIADVVFGKFNPSGRLPVTWPKVSGQVPIYYNIKNTGRPAHSRPFTFMENFPLEAHQHTLGHATNYIDAGFEPQFPFGFGLSYSNVEYGQTKTNKAKFKRDETFEISNTVKNTGDKTVTETVQLYIRDITGTVTRPIQELKRFKRIELQPGEEKRVSFTLTKQDLKFFNRDVDLVFEAGTFHAWVAPHAMTKEHTVFEVL